MMCSLCAAAAKELHSFKVAEQVLHDLKTLSHISSISSPCGTLNGSMHDLQASPSVTVNGCSHHQEEDRSHSHSNFQAIMPSHAPEVSDIGLHPGTEMYSRRRRKNSTGARKSLSQPSVTSQMSEGRPSKTYGEPSHLHVENPCKIRNEGCSSVSPERVQSIWPRARHLQGAGSVWTHSPAGDKAAAGTKLESAMKRRDKHCGVQPSQATSPAPSAEGVSRACSSQLYASVDNKLSGFTPSCSNSLHTEQTSKSWGGNLFVPDIPNDMMHDASEQLTSAFVSRALPRHNLHDFSSTSADFEESCSQHNHDVKSLAMEECNTTASSIGGSKASTYTSVDNTANSARSYTRGSSESERDSLDSKRCAA
jgi:hypothetical protein